MMQTLENLKKKVSRTVLLLYGRELGDAGLVCVAEVVSREVGGDDSVCKGHVGVDGGYGWADAGTGNDYADAVDARLLGDDYVVYDS